MKRSLFLKSILGIAIVPKIAIETQSNLKVTKDESGNISKLCSKVYVSSIDFIDERKINKCIYEKAQDAAFEDIMKLIHK